MLKTQFSYKILAIPLSGNYVVARSDAKIIQTELIAKQNLIAICCHINAQLNRVDFRDEEVTAHLIAIWFKATLQDKLVSWYRI